MAMSALWSKLNLKDQSEIAVLNAPDDFAAHLRGLSGVKVHTRLSGLREVGFALAFVTRQAQVDSLAKSVAKRAPGDAVVWFAYPKGSSKRYSCDFNRDTGWKALGALGFEGVRQVAVDADWSALRFRRAELIKSMKRDPKRAMSETGRRRTATRKR